MKIVNGPQVSISVQTDVDVLSVTEGAGGSSSRPAEDRNRNEPHLIQVAAQRATNSRQLCHEAMVAHVSTQQFLDADVAMGQLLHTSDRITSVVL